VFYNDSFVLEFDFLGKRWLSHPLDPEFLRKQDYVLIVTDHSIYDWGFIVQNSKLVFDT